MLSKVTIIRHAPTIYNKKNIFMGTEDIPVDNLDNQNIEEVRIVLNREKYTAVYSSPLQRALETAKLILQDDYNIIIDERLTERNLGKWQGLKKEDVKMRYKNAFKNGIMDFYYTPQDGETYSKMVSRISEFIVDRCKDGENIVIFTHNGVFRVMKSLITGESLNGVFSEFEPFLKPQTFQIDDEILSKIEEDPFYTVDKYVI